MAGDGTLSELQLGIRELFRIVVPGAFGVLVLNVLPNVSLPSGVADSTAGLTGTAFFIGLVGYALRPHECWWPYLRTFWKEVGELNAAISLTVGGGDHKSLYKYFLAVGRRDFGNRVHYFSSFYYMLVTLSVYSALAAVWVLVAPAISLAVALDTRGFAIASVLFCLAAVAAQVGLIVTTRKMKEVRQLFLVSPLLLLGAAVATVAIGLHGVGGLAFFSLHRAFSIMSFGVLAVLFNVLAARQWRSIINEQIVHVLASQAKLKTFVTSGSSS